MAAELRLPVLALSGLSPDSLGNYLASLGLLRVLSRKWPSTRIAWREDILQVVGGPSTLDELVDELVSIATNRSWTRYDRAWASAQKQSSELAKKPKTKELSGLPFALWQASAPEELLDEFTAHVVAHGTGRSMNPILGKAGKIGQRDFAKGWARATELLALPKPCKMGRRETPRQTEAREEAEAAAVRAAVARMRNELKSLVLGAPISWLENDLNAATWFSQANKIYNNGQKAFRDGSLSPWLMVLACEGIPFLSGGTSRRLGARARAVAAFPFVTRAAAPGASGSTGRDAAELWAPMWERPMTASEVVGLFRRGRAELSDRSAQTPGAFASAILRRGVDADVVEFRRFVLGWTTAQDYVEPRFQGVVAAPRVHDPKSRALSTALERVSTLIEHRGFPRDRKVGQRWRFVGLRGPIESALLDVAAEPNRPEAGIAMLDAIVSALDRIDRNRGFRAGKVRWEPLPLEWLSSLFVDQAPGVEARLALSLLSAFSVAQPFATFRFGIEWRSGAAYAYYTHAERAPARWVWGPGEVRRVLGNVLVRKLLDQETDAEKAGLRGVGLPATTEHLRQWLGGEIDESLLSSWLSRLALFDWRQVSYLGELVRSDEGRCRVDPGLALVGLLQPLIDERALIVRDLSPDDLLSDETGARTTEAARSL
ncbi:MAG: type I-U CRISPR-associated protein Csx17, partial [Acidobacteria bacterium]|nr:type I-U CRISPR-associated protein Csx17 [Acidobacteriota bacterium]